MAVDPSVRIDIAAEFTGRKAFKQADTSTAQLTKNVKNLAKTFGVAFSTAKVLAYAKASVKAAAADQKAQQQLALALKNVGLGRDAATAEGYIQRIEKEFGIIDDKLRPAYVKLAIATRNTAETERLMGIAMDISANSGKDLESVTAALSKAYLGNNATLSKLGIGISKADLKTKSFKEITDQLAVTFAGAAKTSADSFSGSMDKLAIASNNAKEIIGTSLIGALQSLGEDDSMATLAGDIEGAASSLANFVDSIVYLKEQVKSIPGAGIFGYLFSGVTDLLGRFSPQRLAEDIKSIKGFQGMGNVSMTGGSNMDTQKFVAKTIAANKNITDKKIKADKLAAANKLKLEKAAAVFDIQRIQIAAALKGKITDEEKTRLLLMQAIEEGNADKAETLAKKLAEIQEKNAEIAEQLLALGEMESPFATWEGSLDYALLKINEIGERMFAIRQKESGFFDTSMLAAGAGITYNPTQNRDRNYDQNNLATPAAIVEAVVNIAEDIVETAAEVVEAAEAITEAAAEVITNGASGGPKFGIGGQPIYDDFGGFADYTGGSMAAGSAAVIDNSVTIVVEGSVLDGDDFSDIINRTMLDNIRRGLSQTPAGVIP